MTSEPILLIGLLVLAGVVAVFAVLALQASRKAIMQIQRDVAEIKHHLVETLDTYNELGEQSTKLVNETTPVVEDIQSVVRNATAAIERVIDLEQSLVDEIEPPVREIKSILAGIRSGLETFHAALRGKKGTGSDQEEYIPFSYLKK